MVYDVDDDIFVSITGCDFLEGARCKPVML